MANYTAADVKRLRELTGSGMLDCKKALENNDGDFDKAVEELRIKGAKDVGKRAERSTAEGLVAAKGGAMIELNSETDFVAKSAEFIALADKIDILTGFWAIDEKPTGSKDPYALRRAALGVIRLVLDNKIRMPLLAVFAKARADANGRDLLSFFGDRLKVQLREQGARHDLVDAVFALEGQDDLVLIVRRIEALTRLWSNLRGRDAPPDMRMTLQQRRRVRLMIQAADGRMNGASYRDIAIAIYGKARVSADPWKTSSIRASVIGLVKGGLAAINGGYLKLLRHRRRS